MFLAHAVDFKGFRQQKAAIESGFFNGDACSISQYK
jgi:hypothetical protein